MCKCVNAQNAEGGGSSQASLRILSSLHFRRGESKNWRWRPTLKLFLISGSLKCIWPMRIFWGRPDPSSKYFYLSVRKNSSSLILLLSGNISAVSELPAYKKIFSKILTKFSGCGLGLGFQIFIQYFQSPFLEAVGFGEITHRLVKSGQGLQGHGHIVMIRPLGPFPNS